MQRLSFYVFGSTGNRYHVYFEGQGQDLRAFCSCPAFQRGGAFCKHAAQMLLGDVTNLDHQTTEKLAQDPLMAVESLRTLSAASPLLLKALSHEGKTAPKTMQVESAEQAWQIVEAEAKAVGLATARHVPTSDDPTAHGVDIFEYGKTGRVKKNPIGRILFSEIRMVDHLTVDENGGYVHTYTPEPRALKWIVYMEGKQKTLGTIERATAEIVDWLKNRKRF